MSMRLVDADALYETLCHLWDRSDSEEFETEVFKTIINAPTVEERKKGKWIRNNMHYKDAEQEFYYYEERCSECGIKRNGEWGYFSFCPNCGADMRDRQRATWELDEKSNRHRCSECLSVASRDDHGAEVLSDYCGVCGARMEKA